MLATLYFINYFPNTCNYILVVLGPQNFVQSIISFTFFAVDGEAILQLFKLLAGWERRGQVSGCGS